MTDTGSLHQIPVATPAALSTTAGSVGDVAAELGAKQLRDLGFGQLSPAAVAQLSNVIEGAIELGKQAHDERNQGSDTPAQDNASFALRIVAGTLGAVLTVSIIAGGLYALRVLDRVAVSDLDQSARMAALEARFEEAEASRLEWETKRATAEADLGKLREAERKLAEKNEEELELLKARQGALVVHLLGAVEQLAKAQGVKIKDPNSTLRLAEAEAQAAAERR